jgi:hypothetical protein
MTNSSSSSSSGSDNDSPASPPTSPPPLAPASPLGSVSYDRSLHTKRLKLSAKEQAATDSSMLWNPQQNATQVNVVAVCLFAMHLILTHSPALVFCSHSKSLRRALHWPLCACPPPLALRFKPYAYLRSPFLSFHTIAVLSRHLCLSVILIFLQSSRLLFPCCSLLGKLSAYSFTALLAIRMGRVRRCDCCCDLEISTMRVGGNRRSYRSSSEGLLEGRKVCLKTGFLGGARGVLPMMERSSTNTRNRSCKALA